MSSKRIYRRQEHWYFHIRGNASRGPFASYREAEAELERHVDRCAGRLSLGALIRAWLAARLQRRTGNAKELELAGSASLAPDITARRPRAAVNGDSFRPRTSR